MRGHHAEHSKTFYLATSLLPAAKRRATRALYAFCRVTDDIVDDSDRTDREMALQTWRDQILGGRPASGDSVALAWADACARFASRMDSCASSLTAWPATCTARATPRSTNWPTTPTA